jgi:hypothetical protein
MSFELNAFHAKLLWSVQIMIWFLPFLFWPMTQRPAGLLLAAAVAAGLCSYLFGRSKWMPGRMRLAALPLIGAAESRELCVADAIAEWAVSDPDAPAHALFELLQQWLVDNALPFILHARNSVVWDMIWTGGGMVRPSITIINSGYTVRWQYDVYDLEGNCLPISQATLIWSGSVWLYRNQPLDEDNGFLAQVGRKLNAGSWRHRPLVLQSPDADLNLREDRSCL